MAKRTKTLVGLDIDPSGIVAAQVARQRPHLRVERGRRRAARARHRPRRRGRRRRRPRRRRCARCTATTRASTSASASASPTRRSSCASSTCRYLERRQGARGRRPLPGAGPASDAARARRCSTTSRSPSSATPTAAASACCSSRRAATWSSASSPRVRAAGLKPEGVDLSAFAMVRALHRAGPDDEHVLYLAIGGLTNLAVAQGTASASSPAPPAAASRRSPSSSPSARADARARPRLARPRRPRRTPSRTSRATRRSSRTPARSCSTASRRIAAEVRNSLDFHRSPAAGSASSRAVADRPRHRHPRLRRRALLRARHARSSSGVVDGAPAGIDAGRVTVAAGLARRGGAGMRAVNLIPVERRRGGRATGRSGVGAVRRPRRPRRCSSSCAPRTRSPTARSARSAPSSTACSRRPTRPRRRPAMLQDLHRLLAAAPEAQPRPSAASPPAASTGPRAARGRPHHPVRRVADARSARRSRPASPVEGGSDRSAARVAPGPGDRDRRLHHSPGGRRPTVIVGLRRIDGVERVSLSSVAEDSATGGRQRAPPRAPTATAATRHAADSPAVLA